MHGYANLTPFSNSTGMLRGGPMIKLPGSYNGNIGISSDNRKKLNISFNVNGGRGFEQSSRDFNTGADITYKPINYLFFTISPGFSKSFHNLQYVTTLDYNGADRYIFSGIDRTTISASIRLNFNLTPDLTLQYWGQPYIASGKYKDYKYILDPMADTYGGRYTNYTDDQQSYNSDDDNFIIDENRDGTNDYSFDNNDFNYQFFLSNLVVRWEFNPGSSLYLVWSQSRDNFNDTGRMDYFNNMGDLFNRDNNVAHNVFLVKFSYRLGLRK
jgi:hypothetical protein